jgi:hypothetical protein
MRNIKIVNYKQITNENILYLYTIHIILKNLSFQYVLSLWG